MSKIRVPIAGTIGKSVRLNPDATEGATVGINLYDASGNVLSAETLAALIAPHLPSTAPKPSDEADISTKVDKQTATTLELNDSSDVVNIIDKYEGKMVFNSNLDRPVWAVGSGPTDTWEYADGTTAHSPV